VWIVDIGWAEARSLHSADVLVRELAVDLVLLNELVYFGGFVGLLELESNDVLLILSLGSEDCAAATLSVSLVELIGVLVTTAGSINLVGHFFLFVFYTIRYMCCVLLV
jgi:hypothetical protein